MKKETKHIPLLFALCSLLFALCSCSFDYGNQGGADSGLPDIVMDNVEYVRVRSADPQARLQAERVERYESRRVMELRNFSFEQFGNRGEDVNAYGRAGNASFEIDSGDIRMGGGVRLEVESEDIIIETESLEWRDKPRTLSGGDEEEVYIYQENGTVFTGIGFHANARQRTWGFSGGAGGSYIHDDEEEAEESVAEETTAAEIAADAGDSGEGE
ncbi:MAG: LPS export ABC transporter periplasmic protein LptC [Treponema sp.]|jgi:LPS export ABC transporter protein LptC|nr:LPS export ABC transporter periplasmic protein LptC [Treponema sp.]